MKKGPLLAMAALFALGAWLVWAPGTNSGLPELRPGAFVEDLRVGPIRGGVEILEAADGSHTYRLLFRDGTASDVFSDATFEQRFGPSIRERLIEHAGNPVFRLLNITSWAGVAWVLIGFAGQAAFFGRMAIQWVASEKERRSVVPEVFWWLSLVGGILLFTYFAWRQDIVGVMGQTTGVVIYARNLRLIHKGRLST